MSKELQQELKRALTIAFSEPFSLLGTYLDNLGAFHTAKLEVSWEDYGKGSDSILSYAERLRKS